MEQDSLKNKTIMGLFWSFSDLILNQGIQFIIQIFLARLLLPEEFGLIGMITIFIAVSTSIIDSGFTSALIREKNSTQEDYSTVFYFNLLMAVALYILLYIGAPVISKFFYEPTLTSILRVLALTLIFNSFGLVQKTMLLKKIDFKTQTIINIISSIVSGIIAIGAAYKGFGVWSLVIRTILMQLIQSTLVCVLNKWVPSFVFKIESFRKVFGFGWKLLLSGLIDTMYKNIYYLIIGRWFSATQLGYYTNAKKLEDMASSSIATSVQKVSYPVLSSMAGDDVKLKSGYRKILKNSVFITFPVMIGGAIIADPLIKIVFGQKWIPSIFYFQLLCFSGMLYPLHVVNLNILKVKGRSDLFLRLEIIKKVISIILIAIVLFCNFGIEGLLWLAIIESIIEYFINSHYSGEFIFYSTKDQLIDILPIAISVVIMAVITYGIGIILPDINWLKIIVQVIVAISVYIGTSRKICREEFNTIYEMLRTGFKRFKAAFGNVFNNSTEK